MSSPGANVTSMVIVTPVAAPTASATGAGATKAATASPQFDHANLVFNIDVFLLAFVCLFFLLSLPRAVIRFSHAAEWFDGVILRRVSASALARRPSARADADIDYTFAQVLIKEARVDYKSNCGNMSSAVGPFAVDEGLVPAPGETATVRIYNTNTQKMIHATFPVAGNRSRYDGDQDRYPLLVGVE